MKKVLCVIICLYTICSHFINIAYAENISAEDFLCGSFVVMDSKQNALIKNYNKYLTSPAKIEQNKMFINVSDLELWGADVSVGKNEINIIYRDFCVSINIGEANYTVNGKKVWDNVLNTADSLMIDFEKISNILNMDFCFYEDMAVMYDGVEINETIVRSVYDKMSEIKDSGIMLELYVSPNGSDSSSGSELRPFKTINRAKEYVKKIVQSGMNGDIYIYISDGVYNEELEFSASDSGKEQYRIIYKGIGDEAVLSCEEKVTSWENVGGNIYRAYIGKNRKINSVFENDVPGIKARFPNDDYEHATGEGTVSKSGFSYDCQLPYISDISGLEAYVWSGGPNAWAADTIPVTGIDTENRYITLSFNAAYDMSATSRFFIQGALELLDSPGEFFYDGQYLYYYPKNLPVENNIITYAGENTLINFQGASRENPVCNITISNINIKNTDRNADAIKIQNTRNVEVSECRIKNIGGNGIYIADYALANRIEDCEITNVGKTGITLVNDSSGAETFSMNGKYNEILNTYISGVGKLDGGSSAIGISTGYNLVKNCVLKDGKRMGISISSTRPGVLEGQTVEGVLITRDNARQATHSQNNTVMFCEISDFMRDSQDGGAIYSWGGDYDNVICYNHIHDVCSPFSFAFGIYLDDGADRFTIKNNIVENLGTYKDGVVYAAIFTKGSGNKVYNNIAANNENALYAYMTQTMVMEPCDYLEYNNNIMYNSGQGAYLHKAYDTNRMKNVQNNIYYSDEKNYEVSGIETVSDLYDWQNYLDNKYDKYSLIDVNPGFYDEDSYRLKYDSPAGKLGIANIDMGKIGLGENYPFDNEFFRENIFLDTSDERIKGALIDLDSGDKIQCNVYSRSDEGYKRIENNALIEIQDTSVAKYENGEITALKKGKTKVFISVGNCNTSYEILVDDKVCGVVIEADSKLYRGQYSQYNVYAVTEAGRYTKENISVDIMDKNIANITDEERIFAQDTGKTLITASYDNGTQTLITESEIEVVSNILFEENFDDENMWLSNDLRHAMLDDSIYHDGTKSAAITNSTGTLTYNGDINISENCAFEFWFYDDMNDGTALLELSGTDILGNAASVVFGVKINAYNKYYVANQTNNTNVLRTKGWHHIVIDMTVDGKITVYIDGNKTDINNQSFSLRNITALKIINLWYAGGTLWKYNFDSLKVYKGINNVSRHKNGYMNIYFEDGTPAENAQNIGIESGDICIEYTFDMTNEALFELYEKPLDSGSDADYVKTECISWMNNAKKITVSPEILKAGTTYRLYMKNQKTIDGITIADDFIEFSTGGFQQNEYNPIKNVSFDNGAVFPVNGAAEYFGNINIDLSMEMNPDSLKNNIFILCENKRIDCEVVTGNKNAVIKLNWNNISPGKKYNVVIGKNAETIEQNNIARNIITYFYTSNDIKIQQKQFYDSFENGLDNWSGNVKAVRNDMSHSGEYCVEMEKNILEYQGPVPANGVYEFWMYDTNVSVNSCLIMEIRGTDANGNDNNIRFGQKNGYNEYIIANGDNNLITTGIKREVGWHRFTVDLTEHTNVKYYIDGMLVAARQEPVISVKKILFGNYWNYGEYGMCIDDVSIWNDMDADVFEKLSFDDLTVENTDTGDMEYDAGDVVTISIDINNMTKNEQKGVIIFAGFINDKLCDITEIQTFDVERNSILQQNINYVLPENFKNYVYKLFIVDGMENIRPLCEEKNIVFQ